jgi:hypothetical protein
MFEWLPGELLEGFALGAREARAKLGTRADAELAVDEGEVGFDRLWADEQPRPPAGWPGLNKCRETPDSLSMPGRVLSLIWPNQGQTAVPRTSLCHTGVKR